jgi:hypothetical protein
MVAMKFAVVAPAPTVTLGGTVALALLLTRATPNPPTGAALLNVTVHAEDPGAFTTGGEHERALRAAVCCMTVIMPPVAEAGIGFARAVDATMPFKISGKLVLVLAGEIVTLAVATTPFAIAVVFIPKTTHVVKPLAAEQARLFPAAVETEPTVKRTFAASAG